MTPPYRLTFFNPHSLQAVLARPEPGGQHMAGTAGAGMMGSGNFVGGGQKSTPGTSSEPLHVTVNDMGWKNNVRAIFSIKYL